MDSTLAQEPESTLRNEQGMNQYLAFMLGTEEYGMDILRVQEIRSWSSITPMPNMPKHILGVINLRGTIVPIFDLRKKLCLDNGIVDQRTVIIVARVEDGQGISRTMGMVVDAVTEVYTVDAEALQPAPDFGGAIDSRSITGLATLDRKMVILINIDHLMLDDAMQAHDQSENDQPTGSASSAPGN